MQAPSWDDFQTFLAVAHAGGLGRAAAQVGVDATTIGRRLKRLEARLGRTLFERTAAGQVLTEAGEALLAQLEPMQRAADAVDAGGDREGLSGHLRVSVSEGFGNWLVAEHLHDFADRHPALSVDIAASSGFLSPSRREADVAVMLARPPRGPVTASKLTDYALRLYAAGGYVARYGMPTAATLAEGHRLVGYIPDMLYSPELRYLDEVGGDLAPSLRSSSIAAQARLVASGAGVGVLPHFVAASHPDLIRVLPEIAITRAFWLVTHRDTRRLRRIAAFCDWLRALVRAHAAVLLPSA